MDSVREKTFETDKNSWLISFALDLPGSMQPCTAVPPCSHTARLKISHILQRQVQEIWKRNFRQDIIPQVLLYMYSPRIGLHVDGPFS